MANKITVKFRADGAKALKTAIDKLAIAQAKLNNTTLKTLPALSNVNKQTRIYNDQSVLATRNTRLLAGAFATLRSKLLLTAFAMNIVKNTVGKLVGLFGEQEDAEKRLEVAIGEVNQGLLDHASSLQQVTRFGDETIISAMALIAAFVEDEKQIKAATEATLDLAAAKGMELNAAADLVAKTLGSETNSLSRYGIVVEGVVGSTERLTSLTNSMGQAFGGQASEQAGTLAGKLERVGNVMGDIAEDVGEKLAGTIDTLATSFLEFNNMLTDNEKKELEIFRTKKELNKLNENIKSNEISGFKTTQEMLDKRFELEQKLLSLTDSENDAARAQHEQAMKFVQIDLDADENQYITKLERRQMFREQIMDMDNSSLASQMAVYLLEVESFRQKEEKKQRIAKRFAEIQKKLQEDLAFRNIQNIGKIAMAVSDNAKTVANIQYGLAVIDAIRSGLSLRKNLQDRGFLPPAPAIAGALEAAAGIAVASQIRAQQFEQGGLVGGRRHSQGGTMIEAERGEFVMSRDAVESIGVDNLEAMNAGGGGASIVINNPIISSEFVESELPELISEAVRKGVDFGMS